MMQGYRRILAVLDITRDNEHVIRRAIHLARTYHAQLGFGGVIDYQPGFECDHIPFMTPRQLRSAMNNDVQMKIEKQITQAGAHGSEILIAHGSQRSGTETLVHDWQADLLLIDATMSEVPSEQLGCDVLTVHNAAQRRGLLQGIANAIAMAF